MSSPRSIVLLIEEEPVLREITAFRLELLGFEVVEKDNAAKASLWISSKLPNLVAIGHISDVDSIEFINRLSDDQRSNHIPVVYLSANSDLEEVQRAFNAGADEYLVTPYDPVVLEKKVVNLIAAAAEHTPE
ncbi:response regulator [Adhaeretor mobilis]|uniref:Phosphate regulon transcriptional regulatory protein PhoB n=1 Tax=Adhaeretor mobilis TaxID=1930276 RepID=A0A517MWV0_9BACT|nr:response regulator [Adhaeretor mobilis]QDS99353.1 Phosphate regulon transcriptional regulatory protein PhoB [Adhaeretor mobilis]